MFTVIVMLFAFAPYLVVAHLSYYTREDSVVVEDPAAVLLFETPTRCLLAFPHCVREDSQEQIFSLVCDIKIV